MEEERRVGGKFRRGKKEERDKGKVRKNKDLGRGGEGKVKE